MRKVFQIAPVGVLVIAAGVSIAAGFRDDALHDQALDEVVARVQQCPGDVLDQARSPAGVGAQALDDRAQVLLHCLIRRQHAERYGDERRRHVAQLRRIAAQPALHGFLIAARVHRCRDEDRVEPCRRHVRIAGLDGVHQDVRPSHRFRKSIGDLPGMTVGRAEDDENSCHGVRLLDSIRERRVFRLGARPQPRVRPSITDWHVRCQACDAPT